MPLINIIAYHSEYLLSCVIVGFLLCLGALKPNPTLTLNDPCFAEDKINISKTILASLDSCQGKSTIMVSIVTG